MLKFAIKNLLIKWAQVVLIILSVTISAGVGILSYNVATQVSEGITNSAGYYSVIVGPSGSATQLAMNTMYFTDEVLGTIPYSVVSELSKDSRVKSVIPYAMADSYNGYNVVGTTSAYLDGKNIKSGEMFDDSSVFQVVLGYNVAKTCDLKVGEEIHTSHSVGSEHKTAFVVAGILEETHTSFDNVVFTQLKSIWKIHEEGEEEESEEIEGEEHEGEEHDHEEMNNMVCAVLVKTVNPSYAGQIKNEYNGRIFESNDGNSYALQAIEPMSVVRNILEDTNSTKYIVYVLCGIILAMNIIIISVITLLNMQNSKEEIKLMRLIGISMGKINIIYIIQNAIMGIISIILSLGISRIALKMLSGFVESMGVVVNIGKIYPLELVILAGIFVISILPTVFCTFGLARKDGINE